MPKQHRHTDQATELGLHRSGYTASPGRPGEPRRSKEGVSSKPWRQMRRDLNGAFGTHSNSNSIEDMKKG